MPAVATKNRKLIKPVKTTRKRVINRKPAGPKPAENLIKRFLVVYTRDTRNNPRGVLAAMRTANGFSVAYSLCQRRLDKFDKEHARALAIGRLFTHSGNVKRLTLPHSMIKAYTAFIIMCEEHFDDELDHTGTATVMPISTTIATVAAGLAQIGY